MYFFLYLFSVVTYYAYTNWCRSSWMVRFKQGTNQVERERETITNHQNVSSPYIERM